MFIGSEMPPKPMKMKLFGTEPEEVVIIRISSPPPAPAPPSFTNLIGC